MKLFHNIMYHANAAFCITNWLLFIGYGLDNFAIFATINLVCAVIAKWSLSKYD